MKIGAEGLAGSPGSNNRILAALGVLLALLLLVWVTTLDTVPEILSILGTSSLAGMVVLDRPQGFRRLGLTVAAALAAVGSSAFAIALATT